MGHDHVVRILLKNGARVDAVRCVSHPGAFQYTTEWCNFQFLKWFNFRMVLHHCSRPHTKDSRPSSTNSSNTNRICTYCRWVSMENGSEFKWLCLFQLQNGETALHAAAMFGHLPVVKQLIAAGSDIHWKNQDGLTPLQVARQQNFTSVVEYLEDRRRATALVNRSNR